MKKIFLAALLVLGSNANADVSIEGKNVALFSCDLNGEKRYGTSINDVPGKCTALPSLEKNLVLVSISNDGSRAFYLDMQSIKWTGDTAELTMLLLKPESSQGEYRGSESTSLFDLKMHKYFDCKESSQRSDKVELFRNFRTNPQLVKTVTNDSRSSQIISNSGSADGKILHFVCSRKYEGMLEKK